MEKTIIIPKSRYKELLEYEAIVKGVERTDKEKLETLYQMVKDIISSSRTWPEKAQILFSPAISGRIKKFAPDFNPKLPKQYDAATHVFIYTAELKKYMDNTK